MKTSELVGPALDWAVAKCEDFDSYLEDLGEGLCYEFHDGKRFIKWEPSASWRQAGPIIESAGISLEYTNGDWIARIEGNPMRHVDYSPLVAAMRLYITIKLGGDIEHDVEIPEELK